MCRCTIKQTSTHPHTCSMRTATHTHTHTHTHTRTYTHTHTAPPTPNTHTTHTHKQEHTGSSPRMLSRAGSEVRDEAVDPAVKEACYGENTADDSAKADKQVCDRAVLRRDCYGDWRQVVQEHNRWQLHLVLLHRMVVLSHRILVGARCQPCMRNTQSDCLQGW
jgi:hypothetical protein